MIYKTPGIYHSHKIAYPPLSGRLAPGIPAILGYTEKAVGEKGVSLSFVPTLLNTWEAFLAQFGGPFPMKAFVGYTQQGTILTASLGDRLFLWESVRLFFENGGREIYIVSIGDYASTPDRKDFAAGLDALRAYDVPSHVLMPDSVLLGVAESGYLHTYTLQHCADHKHRFAILDLVELHNIDATIGAFRDHLVSTRLDLGAAYYPWIRTTHSLEILPENIEYGQIVRKEPKEMTMEMRVNLKEAITERTIKAFDTSTETDWAAAVASRVVLRQTSKKVESLTTDNFDPLSGHLKALRAQLAKGSAKTVKQDLVNYLGFTRSIILGFTTFPKGEGGLPKELGAYIERERSSKKVYKPILCAVSKELDPDIGAAIGRNEEMVKQDYGWLAENKLWIDAWPPVLDRGSVKAMETPMELEVLKKEMPQVLDERIKAEYEKEILAKEALPGKEMVSEFIPVTREPIKEVPVEIIPSKGLAEVAKLVAADEDLYNAAKSIVEVYSGLFELASRLGKKGPDPIPDPVPDSVKAEALKRLSGLSAWLPPSGAVAGLYATTDRERGPFKAPANASLHAVLDVGHRLTVPQQEDMNASDSGKAVNALLIKPGRGIVVNAARTFDANSREWRYVPVRRYFLAVEKAVRDRLQDYVFESNDPQLWENVRGMLAGFCNQQFKSGALAGKYADDAYFISIGLGETMTAEDINEGKLIVKIGLAVARPAEFIVLTFVHHMESDKLSIQN